MDLLAVEEEVDSLIASFTESITSSTHEGYESVMSIEDNLALAIMEIVRKVYNEKE